MNNSKLIKAFIAPATYQIMVDGHVDSTVTPLLGDMSITYLNVKGQELSNLIGKVTDQSALSGLINTLIDYRYTVISVIMINQS